MTYGAAALNSKREYFVVARLVKKEKKGMIPDLLKMFMSPISEGGGHREGEKEAAGVAAEFPELT